MAETSATPEERKSLWLSVYRSIVADINRLPGPTLDETDLRGYAEVLGAIRTPFLGGEMDHTDPRIWRIRFALRDMQQRPNYSQVRELVETTMGYSAPCEARNVLRAPAPLALPAGPAPKREFDAQTYRPDYGSLPADPREWRREMFATSYEFYCAVHAAQRDRRHGALVR